MFVTVDRKGGKPVDAAFRARIRNFIDQFRLAAYDLEIEAPIYVPLDIALERTIAWERENPPAPLDQKQFDYAAEDLALSALQTK